MSGYDEIGAINFANGFLLAGGRTNILRKILTKEYDLDEATANWHIGQAQRWVRQDRKELGIVTVKMMDKYMYLPAMTEEEFAENIGRRDFFRTYGNPVVVHTKAEESYIALSAELYDRMAELSGFPGTKELIDHEPRT